MQARPRRPSVTSRLSFAISTVSNAERGETVDGPTVVADQQIEEEIAEIKRYEVAIHPFYPPPPKTSCNTLLTDDARRTLQP